MKGKAGWIKEKEKGERRQKEKKGKREDEKRNEGETRTIGKDGERRANDLAEKTKREQEGGKTEDHPERRTDEESLKPPFKRNEAKDEPLRRKRGRKRKNQPSKPDGNEKAPQ
ncbi:hypothetical protein [Bifidobacterium adolescentis]|uniref:Uncharacterized protein n=1 Tax=Bifidobacterium adolescentis TaxID=1680 RepID=A0AAF0VGS8_BIFAD|nr:hypothetical protein [Bifidobacterium adolescentis]WNE86284.1 hypothetical protein B0703_05105 [Bifidobacterium adolescentis]